LRCAYESPVLIDLTYTQKIKVGKISTLVHRKTKSVGPLEFGVHSKRPKTVLQTDLSVALTDKSVVTTDFVRCLNNHDVITWPWLFAEKI
jgi:hypothetical protein